MSSLTCKGVTKRGRPCRVKVKNGEYCRYHKKPQMVDFDNECPVCLDKNGYLLSCGHRIHLDCAKNMLMEECPVCREKITNWPSKILSSIRKNIENDRKRTQEDDLAQSERLVMQLLLEMSEDELNSIIYSRLTDMFTDRPALEVDLVSDDLETLSSISSIRLSS